MTKQKLGCFKQLMKSIFLKALKYILFFIPIKNGQLFIIPDSTMRDEPCGITTDGLMRISAFLC